MPGSGAPKSARMQRSARTANEMAGDPRPMPLEIMCETMWEYWEAGRKAEACAIAEKAAVYLHPRLSSVEAVIAHKVESMSDADIDREIANLITQFGASTGTPIAPLAGEKGTLN